MSLPGSQGATYRGGPLVSGCVMGRPHRSKRHDHNSGVNAESNHIRQLSIASNSHQWLPFNLRGVTVLAQLLSVVFNMAFEVEHRCDDSAADVGALFEQELSTRP